MNGSPALSGEKVMRRLDIEAPGQYDPADKHLRPLDTVQLISR